MKLSVIIIAKNETRHIKSCLQSVIFADEVIVIDDYSTDDTAQIAENMGAQVYQRSMNGDFAGQQNFAIEHATGDWLLFLDCDERITPALATEIQHVICLQKYAYRIKRFNHFAGQRVRFGTLRSDSVCRLTPNQSVRFEGLVHQKLIHNFEEKTLKHAMLHYTYSSWSQYYKKFDHYTRLSALQYFKKGKKVSVIRDLTFRPVWAFFKMYIIHGGFLDGTIGWLLAVNHYHYTLAKYARLYTLQKNGEDAL